MRIVLVIGLMLLAVGVAFSAVQQQRPNSSVPGFLVVTTCGTLPSGITYAAGTYQVGTIDTTGKRC